MEFDFDVDKIRPYISLSEIPDQKCCGHCKKVKPISDFNLDRGSADQHQKRCRVCDHAMQREVLQRNPARSKIYGSRHRHAKLLGDLRADDWNQVLEQFNNRCAYCGSADQIELDHVIPICQGGLHTKENVVPACLTCNRRKAGRTPEQANMIVRGGKEMKVQKSNKINSDDYDRWDCWGRYWHYGNRENGFFLTFSAEKNSHHWRIGFGVDYLYDFHYKYWYVEIHARISFYKFHAIGGYQAPYDERK